MKRMKLIGVLFLLGTTGLSESARSQQQQGESAQLRGAKLPAHAKVYVAPMGGFEIPFKKALADKKVPFEIVAQRELAEYEITGTSESKKAGTAKKLIMGSWHSDEEASIKVASVKSGEIVYAYSAHKQDSAHGQRSTAEACAKHLKDEAIAAKLRNPGPQ
jgi:hypothetical protein